MEEIWRDVVVDKEEADTYKGLYQVSNLGRIKSFHRGKEKILDPSLSNQGYLTVTLSKDGKQKVYLLHRLIGLTFIKDAYFEGAEIDHIDTIKTNNRVENLRWATRTENSNNELTKRHYSKARKGGKNPNSRAVICITTGEIFASAEEGAECYGIERGSSVARCCRGERKSCSKHPITNEPLVWKYLDE